MDGLEIIMLLLCLNIVFYIGSDTNKLMQGDIIDNLLSKSDLNNNKITVSSAVSELQNIQEDKGIIQSITDTFFDGLGMVLNFLKLLLNIATSPITIFLTVGMHFIFALCIGVPLMIAELISVVVLIRGGGW